MTKDINENDLSKKERKELKKKLRKEEKKAFKEKEKNKVSIKLAIKRLVLLVLIILWAFFVFGFSNQTGEESSGLSRMIAELFFKTEEALAIAEPIIRKIAHFSEYALGAVLMYLLADTYPYSTKKKFFIVLFLGIWYASIDEIHQTFVPERSGNVFDVCIDTLGFITGMCLTIFYLNMRNRLKLKKELKKEQKKEGK